MALLAWVWAWLYANTLGNLVASVIWTIPALYIHHRRLKAHHQRLVDELRAQLRGEGD